MRSEEFLVRKFESTKVGTHRVRPNDSTVQRFNKFSNNFSSPLLEF